MSMLLDASVLLASEDPSDPQFEAASVLVEGGTQIATLDLAYYETSNVASRVWRNPEAASRLVDLVNLIENDGGVVRANAILTSEAISIASEHGITTYDAAYVAAARSVGAQLVSCDVRDLVSKGLAVLPDDVAGSVSD